MSNQPEPVQELIDTFNMLEAWEEKYSYLIDLGRELPPLDEEQHVEANRVHGCQSNVWLTAVPVQKEGKMTIDFIADSDSKIVCGLIAVLRRAYAQKSPKYIVNYDIQALFQELQLEQHLTLGRRNGLASMVARIQKLAQLTLNSQGAS